MDVSTLLGFLLAFGALLISLFMEGSKISALISISSFILVVGGTVGATVAGIPMERIKSLPKILKKAFLSKPESQRDIIEQMVNFTRKARREGILALEEEARQIENRILSSGLQLVVDGTPGEAIREILETDVLAMQERHKNGANIFMQMGGYSPTLGIIGTVMGLVHMLANLKDPNAMGPMIASAFLATFYGISFANLVLFPIGNKLKNRSAEEIALYEMIIEGILSIQAGDNPRIVEAKMSAFLSPELRNVGS